MTLYASPLSAGALAIPLSSTIQRMPARYRPKSADEVRRNMTAIRSSENKTEVSLRRALHAMGLRYRKYAAHLPGRPDIIFARARTVIFVDGDYWHARELVEGTGRDLRRRLQRLPLEKREYWREKFRGRVVRDRAITLALEADGWLVIRLWESDVRRDVEAAARGIAARVRRRHRRPS